jgi:predicted TIM-barrel fold metal-dependent hydrolase
MASRTERLIIVSGDSHATPPPELWPEYLETKYHDLLPEVHEDNERYTQLLGQFANFPPEVLEVIDKDGAWASGGYLGAWDPDVRLAEMDREGVAAEMVYGGDPRAILPLSTLYRRYPPDVVAGGARAYHRWAADVFGKARDRFLLVGDPATAPDMDGMLTELRWIADHGFVGAYVPGVSARADLPALYDEYFEPFWSLCEDLGLALVVHAGYGSEQCEFMDKIEDIRQRMEAAGRNDLLSEIINNAEGFFSLDLRPRRAMWQVMLGGVFDRHPKLKLVMAEVRGDWLPATLRHLDAAYDRARADLPSQRRPSEYWQEHCLMSLSFVHKSEVAMRHELGIETIFFGRDYPHAEGTWPNTADWLTDAFAGVPDDELRLMLGENAIRVLSLDRVKLAAIADRIGPTIADVTGRTPDLDPRLIANWDARGGYLKPPEEIDPHAIDAFLGEDIALVAAKS